MSNIGLEGETIGWDEWVKYQEMELKQDEMKLRVDHFWQKIFCNIH